MKHRRAALLLVLASSALWVGQVAGQRTGAPPPNTQRVAGSLGKNYPNPFNPTTTIPFSIGMEGDPPVCVEPDKKYRVSLRIYDVLSKLVAVPIMRGGDQAGQPVDKLVLSCSSSFEAFWDGTRIGSGQTVPSGTYVYILEVDGRATSKKMFVAK